MTRMRSLVVSGHSQRALATSFPGRSSCSEDIARVRGPIASVVGTGTRGATILPYDERLSRRYHVMPTLATPAGQLGFRAPSFDLPGVDGRRHTLESVRGRNGVLVMFICNHCPYVKAVVDKIVRDARDLTAEEIGSIAIMSNDPTDYPEDSFENMKVFAARHGFR